MYKQSIKQNNVEKSYVLFAKFWVKSHVLEMLMKEHGSALLREMFDEKEDGFIYSTIIYSPLLYSYMDYRAPKSTITVKFNPSEMSQELSELIHDEVEDKLLEGHRRWTNISPQTPENVAINYEALEDLGIKRFISAVHKDQEISKAIFYNNMSHVLIFDMNIVSAEITEETPLIQENSEMESANEIKKALQRHKMEYEKFKNHPTLSIKIQKEIQRLEQSLENFK